MLARQRKTINSLFSSLTKKSVLGKKDKLRSCLCETEISNKILIVNIFYRQLFRKVALIIFAN